MFLYQKLTALQFGPKITCREPGQLEVTLFARGTWQLRPDGSLTQIEDPVAQGFMSGDVWPDTDPDREGPVEYASDFADFKPRADLLLTGTAYAPGGKPTTVVDVGFTVGAWSKSLMAIGARAWKKGLLFGASMSDPEPFVSMPLTWENAFGGEGYRANPVGKGIKRERLPTVERPRQLVGSSSDKPLPASFAPISPLWFERTRKRGKKYGKAYQKTRAPWYSEDFDWSFFNAAPDDQQLEGYLRGDEPVVFSNLHPEASLIETRLPGVRPRAFLKHTDGRFVEVPLVLDTLYADMDAMKVYLTWRGLSPVESEEFEDIACGLLVEEALADAPQSVAHYRKVLEDFEDDPLGLEDKFPPGFLAMGEALEAEEAAELAGNPVPLEQRVDPFGIRAAFPAGVVAAAMAGSDDPFGAKQQFPDGLLELHQQLQLGKVPVPPGLETHPELPNLTEMDRLMLNMAPADQRQAILDEMTKGKQHATEKAGDALPPREEKTLFAVVGTALAVPGKPPTLAVPPGTIEDPRPKLHARSAELKARKQRLLDKGIDHPLLGLFERGQRMITSALAMATGMLDAKTSPLPPSADLGPAKDGLQQAKQNMAEHGQDGQFDEESAKVDQALEGIAQIEAAFPPPVPVVHDDLRDFHGQDLRGRDFSGQDLSGKSFAEANLGGANLADAKLDGAIFRDANLCEANLSGASLVAARFVTAAVLQADLRGAKLDGAVFERCGLGQSNFGQASLVGVDLRESACEGARFEQADLSQVRAAEVSFKRADLTGAKLIGADLTQADLAWAKAAGADFSQANLTKAVLTRAECAEAQFAQATLIEADLQQTGLVGACLDGADLDSCLAERADLTRASLKQARLNFAIANKVVLEGADLTGADLSLANLNMIRGDGCDLSRTTLAMTQLAKSRLQGAKLNGSQGQMTLFEKCDLRNAQLRDADLSTCKFDKAVLEGASFDGTKLVKASLRGVKAKGASFVRADLSQAAASEEADFSGARLLAIQATKSIWLDARLDGADLSYAQLRGSFFQGCKAKGARFYAAELKGAAFRNAELDTVFFGSANLAGVDFVRATLLDCQLQKANCYGLVVLGAELARCDFQDAFVHAWREDKDTVKV